MVTRWCNHYQCIFQLHCDGAHGLQESLTQAKTMEAQAKLPTQNDHAEHIEVDCQCPSHHQDRVSIHEAKGTAGHNLGRGLERHKFTV